MELLRVLIDFLGQIRGGVARFNFVIEEDFFCRERLPIIRHVSLGVGRKPACPDRCPTVKPFLVGIDQEQRLHGRSRTLYSAARIAGSSAGFGAELRGRLR